MTDIAKLAAPFPPVRISWRVGSTTADKKRGMALAYIDARDVQDRLDEVCGPFGWQCRHEVSNDKRVTCHVGICSPDGTWVWKSDGAGETDYEAEKGSYSDSFKRAAVKWGVGRYLYDLASPWVEIEASGKSFKICKHEEPRLLQLLSGAMQLDDGFREHAADQWQKWANSDEARNWLKGAKQALAMFKTGDDLRRWSGAVAKEANALKKHNAKGYEYLEKELMAAEERVSAAA